MVNKNLQDSLGCKWLSTRILSGVELSRSRLPVCVRRKNLSKPVAAGGN